jgi:hypothetical protein
MDEEESALDAFATVTEVTRKPGAKTKDEDAKMPVGAFDTPLNVECRRHKQQPCC